MVETRVVLKVDLMVASRDHYLADWMVDRTVAPKVDPMAWKKVVQMVVSMVASKALQMVASMAD